jgi:hypothetical protein
MPTIPEARARVQHEVHQLVALVDRPSQQTATEVEMALWSGVLQLGMALMALFLAHQARKWPTGVRYELDGVAYEVVGTQPVELGTRFGKIGTVQPIARVVGRPRERRDFPMVRALGLPGGFTLPVVTLVAKFCALMAFAPTRQVLRDLFEWAPAPRSVLRMIDSAGAYVRDFLDQSAVPEGDTDVLVIMADGKGAPAISSAEHAKRRQPHRKNTGGRRQKKSGSAQKRRGPGKKSKNAKMAAVGVICTLKIDDSGNARPVNKRIYATFKSYRALFVWLKAEADRRGYGTNKFKKVQFVADGADILWQLQQEFFPDAEGCLDWAHAVEKLWACGKAVNRGSRTKRKPLEAWVHEQKKLLRRGKLAQVLSTLQSALDQTATTGPGNKFRRKILEDTIKHFAKNRTRMRYQHLRKQGLVIGSGLIEGTVRHLVGMRLDGPGMRWGKARAEAVLHLRCVLLNGLWADFESYLANIGSFRLIPKPVETVTHDAKPQLKKAA